MHNGFFPPISFWNISDYRLQPRLFMGWWKDVSKKILKFELYCFLLELSCLLPVNDIFPCFMVFLYISILHKASSFQICCCFFCTLQMNTFAPSSIIRIDNKNKVPLDSLRQFNGKELTLTDL